MSSKTITIKIDLSSCDDCAQRMKRLIRELKGIESSSIDVKNSLVIVSGRISHPDKIIDHIRNTVKPVTMFSVQYDEEIANDANDDDTDYIHADEVSEPATTPNLQESRDRGGDQNKVHVHAHESEDFCTGDGDQNREGISDHIFCCFRGKQPRAHKPKKKVHFVDDELESTGGSRSMPWSQPKISKRDSGECSNRKADIDHKCKVRGCQSEVRNCQCTRCKWPPHAEEPKRVHFAFMPSFYPRQEFDDRNYPGMMGHHHGQTPQQHFENGPMAFRAQYFRDDSPSGCRT